LKLADVLLEHRTGSTTNASIPGDIHPQLLITQITACLLKRGKQGAGRRCFHYCWHEHAWHA
jgi:hypothetical protein